MKQYILLFFRVNSYLFGLYLLPYLVISLPHIVYSDIFSFSKLVLILFPFFILHILMLRLSKSENTFVRIFIIFSFTAYVIFLYGQIISNATPTFLNNLASLKIRWRHILLLLSLIIIAIQFLFWKKKEAMLKFINTTTLYEV